MSSRNDARVPFPVNGGTQSVAFLVTSVATTNAVGVQTRRVSLYASTDCHVRFEGTPTATTSDFFLPAGTQIMLAIRPSQKVAAIRASADGTLYVSELDY